MQIKQRIFNCTDMQIMYFVLDKIPKRLTYYTPFYRCKVIWSQKQSGFLDYPVVGSRLSGRTLVFDRRAFASCPVLHLQVTGDHLCG